MRYIITAVLGFLVGLTIASVFVVACCIIQGC